MWILMKFKWIFLKHSINVSQFFYQSQWKVTRRRFNSRNCLNKSREFLSCKIPECSKVSRTKNTTWNICKDKQKTLERCWLDYNNPNPDHRRWVQLKNNQGPWFHRTIRHPLRSIRILDLWSWGPDWDQTTLLQHCLPSPVCFHFCLLRDCSVKHSFLIPPSVMYLYNFRSCYRLALPLVGYTATLILFPSTKVIWPYDPSFVIFCRSFLTWTIR